ncbi:EPIDERMAL PATTERNING FACTOR-like protein 5 [Juglans microcarpa x Juglans regia]|uniref:EPIDERMAL PATTERNING FACTOR-like protein 5 n=1 Tax=Juglans microcarpa x Juglans regia TaxID=2249226 RepID=UPI001B7F5B81|nr:EPIDERMAL PATTERNING FACTOR-like protein 5 [Juglans microcarpa x Juglans regia]
MGVLHRRHHHRHCCRTLQTLTAFTFLFFASATAISLSQHGSQAVLRQQAAKGEKRLAGSGSAIFERFVPSRRALGFGSSPPTCRSKCGRCSPCSPVRVPIHPTLSTPLEYYPEAWRCQCGNKHFMP